jgi:hypothetical protein
MQKTPAMVSPRAMKASRTALPNSCCPMKAMRAMMGLRLVVVVA